MASCLLGPTGVCIPVHGKSHNNNDSDDNEGFIMKRKIVHVFGETILS